MTCKFSKTDCAQEPFLYVNGIAVCDECVEAHNYTPCGIKSNQTVKDEFCGVETTEKEVSDGASASYYKLPKCATQLQHLISANNMNAQIGEIFRACYRYGRVAHSPKLRDINKILFYANAEKERLLALQSLQNKP